MKVNAHIPSEWYKRHPLFGEVENFYREGMPDALGTTTHLADYETWYLWKQVPPKIRIMSASHSGWHSRDNPGHFAADVTQAVWGDGRYKDSPFELTFKLMSLRYHFGQCVRRGHALVVSPLSGVQACELISPEAEHALRNTAMLLHPNYVGQVGVCTEHRQEKCVTCTKTFALLEQEPRYWVSTTSECSGCLAHQLMYVQPQHSVKSVKLKGKVYRKTGWSVESVPVPTGPPPSPGGLADGFVDAWTAGLTVNVTGPGQSVGNSFSDLSLSSFMVNTPTNPPPAPWTDIDPYHDDD